MTPRLKVDCHQTIICISFEICCTAWIMVSKVISPTSYVIDICKSFRVSQYNIYPISFICSCIHIISEHIHPFPSPVCKSQKLSKTNRYLWNVDTEPMLGPTTDMESKLEKDNIAYIYLCYYGRYRCCGQYVLNETTWLMGFLRINIYI